MKPNWQSEAAAMCPVGTTSTRDYRSANAGIIQKTIDGIGIDSGKANAGCGIRIAFNISSAHLPAVLDGDYKNCYDLASGPARIGDVPPRQVGRKRQRIDETIAALFTVKVHARDLYYGAVELNGSGMRYYGDLCLVLETSEFKDDTLILYRNSYDLDREPIRGAIDGGGSSLKAESEALAGDRLAAPDMFVCKILGDERADRRLLTTGQISRRVLDDEDYLEVPRAGRFGCELVSEIRAAASDAAAEARIADRVMRGPPPTLAEMIWRSRRRDAERAATAKDLPLRVVTSDGRVR